MTEVPFESRQLRYFVTVAEELHFGRAAQKLHMAQPPLSQAIQKLEKQIGCRLFERKPHVSLTAAGAALLTRARPLLDEIAASVENTRRVALGETGELTLAFAVSALTTALPQVIHLFRRRFPEIRLRLHELSTTDQLDSLRSGAIDVGVVRTVPTDPRLRSQTFLREPFVAVLPADHPSYRQGPIPIARLATEPFVLFPRAVAVGLYEEVMALCSSAGFTPHVVQEAREWLTIVGLVEAGLGVSIVPASFRKLRWGSVVYQDLKDAPSRTTISLCVRSDAPPPAAVNFLEIAQAFSSSELEVSRTQP